MIRNDFIRRCRGLAREGLPAPVAPNGGAASDALAALRERLHGSALTVRWVPGESYRLLQLERRNGDDTWSTVWLTEREVALIKRAS